MQKVVNDIEVASSVMPIWTGGEGIFKDHELKLIESYCESFEKTEGAVLGNERDPTHKTRSSDINFHVINNENSWIFERLNQHIDYHNERYFRYDLVGYDHFQYSTYDAEKDGRYDWHIDAPHASPVAKGLHRKLSMSLLLNDDFEGGRFEVTVAGNVDNVIPIDLKRGSAVFFPSYLPHRVAPVTKGIRKSIVVWVEGPKFR